MHRFLILAFCVPLSACALMHREEIATPPPDEAPATQAATVTAADLLPPPAPIECVNIVQLPALVEQAPAKLRKGQPQGSVEAKIVPVDTKYSKPRLAAEIIQTAQREAMVGPTEKTYFGKTSEATYTWQPGSIYKVFVAPGHMTSITLPPKENLLIGLAMREEEFAVSNKKVGRDDQAYFVVSITPQAEAHGDYQVFLLTDTGHKYDLKLVVGTLAETGVRFQIPTIHEEDNGK